VVQANHFNSSTIVEALNDKNSQSGCRLKSFFGLSYLPLRPVSDAFVDIMAKYKCLEEIQFSTFSDYMLENYIENGYFSPSARIEEPNGSTRTKNGAKSHHNKLRRGFYISFPPNIFHSVCIQN